MLEIWKLTFNCGARSRRHAWSANTFEVISHKHAMAAVNSMESLRKTILR